jgi:hypothetical protein
LNFVKDKIKTCTLTLQNSRDLPVKQPVTSSGWVAWAAFLFGC